jgi:hypothetical protein
MNLGSEDILGANLLTLVDERLKEDQEARKLELEELKAAARRAYVNLHQMGLSDGALRELAERDPEIVQRGDHSACGHVLASGTIRGRLGVN